MEKEKKRKMTLNFCFFISLLICYIDGYKYGSEFFFQTEVNFITAIFSEGFLFTILSVLLMGQILLLIAPFTNKYNLLTIFGILFTMPFWAIVMLISMDNLYSFFSAIPYLILLILFFYRVNFKSFFKYD